MPQIFTRVITNPLLEGRKNNQLEISVNTGLFINGKFVDPIEKSTLE